MIKILVTAIAIMLTTCALHAAEYHVSPGGLDSNEGSKSNPFKTISAATTVAHPGDVITVYEGTYRERVNPPRGGTSDDKRIVYQAAPGEKVVIKGSEIIKQWQKVAGSTWKVTLPNSFFGDFNPYNDIIKGEWHHHKGYPRNTGTVYVNGVWMDEAKTKEQVLGQSGHPRWKAEVDEKNTTIWARFKGIDPNKELVEINVRQSIFYPDKPGRNYITVRGFTMRQAATPWSGAMSEQIGLIGTHWSKGWIIENNVISHSMNTGITLGRYDLGEFSIALPEVSAPGFVRSYELAIEHGWSKEKIGNHVVRNNHISHCEKNGIHGSLGGIFSVIEGNTICDIAMRGWIHGADIAGLKLLGSHDTVIRNNHIYRCVSKGIWLDWMAQGARVTGNLLHHNNPDLYMEVNHGPFLVDNNLFLSANSLRDWSQGGAYVHNLFKGSITVRPVPERKTPFHKAHSTELAGLQAITCGDDRFHNNVFVGRTSSTIGYDKLQRMQMSGNVYLADAKASIHDSGATVLTGFNPSLKLEEKDGDWWLEMSTDPAWVAPKKRQVVTTELLGKAKVPDLPFEQPDGTAYRLDTDYLGKKQNPEKPTPGPFAAQDDVKIQLKVWPKK